MATSSEVGHGKYRLFALIVLFNISLSAAVSLDLTELRNKVSKIKVHPRGNLWATGTFSFSAVFGGRADAKSATGGLPAGHFMGKKSLSNSQLQDPPSSSKRPGNALGESGSSEDLKELITQEVLRVALQAQLEDPRRTRGLYDQDTDFMVKLLKNYIEKRNL
ncbi:neuromedin Ba isoform X1 [Puntigrus tetrazona]|uniref:neuromedin Ba isoform X1 n=1 Tax=Puntigrus tetrazona TaxID=1606681 RepID=UPI001C89C9B3|nr:neuromedin Ba isoform X1 [Puntigrus tetrazona]